MVATTIQLNINLDNLVKVRQALDSVGDDIANRIIYLALNRTGDSTFTQLKRMVAERSGRKVSYVAGRTEKKVAFTGKLSYEMKIRDWWPKISAAEFRAGETEGGVTYVAWEGPKVAQRAFMLGYRAFKRRGPGDIKTLFGPNVAREVIRAAKEVEALLEDQVQTVFVVRVMHETDRALASAKAKGGL